MKEVVSFTATGKTKREVNENALKMYRDFIEDQEAVFPQNTVVQFSPEIVEQSTHDGAVTVSLVTWYGSVTISQSNTK